MCIRDRSETNDVCFGYNEINFSKPEDIKIAQVGFKYDENGNLYNEKKWKDSWIVIATDNLCLLYTSRCV